MTTRKVAGLLESLSKPGGPRQTSIITEGSQRVAITPQERILFLNQEIGESRARMAEVDDLWDDEDVWDLVAYYRHCESERYEMVYLVRRIARLQLSGAQPTHYEEWVPWAQATINEQRRKEPEPEPEPGPTYHVWWQFQKSKRTLVPLSLHGRRPESQNRAESKNGKPRRPRKKPHIWLLRIVCQRLSLVVRLQRGKK